MAIIQYIASSLSSALSSSLKTLELVAFSPVHRSGVYLFINILKIVNIRSLCMSLLVIIPVHVHLSILYLILKVVALIRRSI